MISYPNDIKRLAVIPIIFNLISCSESSSLSNLKMEVNADNLKPKPEIDEGYDSDSSTFLVNRCLTGKIYFGGEPKSEQSYEQEMSMNSILDKINGKISASAKYGLMKASMNAEYAASLSSSDYAFTLNYWYVGNHLSKMVGEPLVLTDKGKLLIEPTSNGDLRAAMNWRYTCGDEFVKQVDYGSSLFVSIRFVFQNKEDAKNFKMNAKFNWGTGNADGSFERVSKEVIKRSKVVIKAFQLGGQEEKISHLLSDSVVDCSLENKQACKETLDKIFEYVRTDFPSQFGQISEDNENGWARRSYITYPYKRIAVVSEGKLVSLEPSPLSRQTLEAIESANKNLTDKYVTESKHKQRAQEIKDEFQYTIDQIRISEVNDILSKSSRNLNKIISAASTCWTNPDECQYVSNPVLETYDASKLDIQPPPSPPPPQLPAVRLEAPSQDILGQYRFSFLDVNNVAWAWANRNASDYCRGQFGYTGGFFTGYQKEVNKVVVCFQSDTWSGDYTTYQTLQTIGAATSSLDAMDWLSGARYASTACKGKGFHTGVFSGEYNNEMFSIKCLNSAHAFYYSLTPASWKNLGTNEIPSCNLGVDSWAKAARAINLFCWSSGYLGGFFDGNFYNCNFGAYCIK
ncbi:MAG: hypothetical protein HQK54_04010 [Oligoflexales bacterium]|nr:hypothetical protein [Oligoflexales bacterium]